MKNRHTNIIQPFLASAILLFSVPTIANDATNDDTNLNRCSSKASANDPCTNYLKGYIDALKQLSETELNPNFSSFEERAYRTRLGTSHQTDPLEDKLGICLPNAISNSELNNILATSSKELPMENALLKAIQAKYPC